MMRLLTDDEMFAVSGGSINGQDDPHSLHKDANSPAELTKACPGGWKKIGRKVDVSTGGVKYEGIIIECDTGNDSDDSGDDSGNDSGDDSNGGEDDD